MMPIEGVQNERTAMAQKLSHQPDGPGLRIGRKGEISGVGKLMPDGARIFRERLPQLQAEAGYWEKRVGTVHDFRVMLFDNDTRILFTTVFDGDFKPWSGSSVARSRLSSSSSQIRMLQCGMSRRCNG